MLAMFALATPIDEEKPYLVPETEEILFNRGVIAIMATELESLAVRSDHQPSPSTVMDFVWRRSIS
jgi:hypothetical protein